jgi:hypothetical protein
MFLKTDNSVVTAGCASCMQGEKNVTNTMLEMPRCHGWQEAA